MKLSEINAYFINPDDYKYRLNGILETLNSIPFKSITRIAFNEKVHGKNNTMTKAHLALIYKAIEDDGFPFILFEDDARKMKDLPEEFNIPEEAGLIYLGGSKYDCGANKPNMYLENYNKGFYRIYYMLSAHAVLVPSIAGANIIINAYEKALDESGYNDVCLALSSKDNIFLVPKDGNYFYQDDYTVSVTKFTWEDIVKHTNMLR
jgi:hypothetical protein